MGKRTKKELIERSKGKNKILWDKVIWSGEEYQRKLSNPVDKFDKKRRFSEANVDCSDGLEEGVCSFYFVIINNRQMIDKIKNRIKQQVLFKAKRILEEKVLIHREGVEVYRISSHSDIRLDFYFGKSAIYGGSRALWIRDESLHTKGPEALENLAIKIEAGQI